MNNLELNIISRKDPVLKCIFAGVFAKNTLPEKIINKPTALIVNTDNSNEKGEHWVSMYFDEDGSVDYFDSYGLHPTFFGNSFTNFMNANSVKQNLTNKCIQSLNSHVCGMYCVYFLHKRCRRIPLQNILNSFHSNLVRNDIFVCTFIFRVFGKKHKVCCSSVKTLTSIPYCKFKN